MAWLPIVIQVLGYCLFLVSAAPTVAFSDSSVFAPASPTSPSVLATGFAPEATSTYTKPIVAPSSPTPLDSPTRSPTLSTVAQPPYPDTSLIPTPGPSPTETPEVATVTVTVTLAPSMTSSVVSSPTSSTSWTQPHQFQNLESFNISNFAYGNNNLDLVTEIPLKAYARPNMRVAQLDFGAFQVPLPPLLANRPSVQHMRTSSEDPTLLQLFYPQSSINPSHPTRPQGGADFYANPLQDKILHSARNVTLSYSVFFPAGFEFALGGKLPGLYGGHERCSGGDDAQACFSTRLMWRKGGLGELYLVSSCC